ncbi:MAG: putative histidine kinase [Candidatus Saccharibacteria bacterium]|nr:putative histidine kinase [Candidatus Saccharibacteria bacterium]
MIRLTESSATANQATVNPEHSLAAAEALFLSLGDGAIVTDEAGRVSRINKVALLLLGYSAKELVGRWYPDAVVAENEDGNRIPNWERPITQVFLEGKSISARVYYRRKDGSRMATFLTVSPVMLDSKPIGAIEVFRDITNEVELEKTKDEFISLASHQLRTPATGVKQYVGMLLEGYAGTITSQQRQLLKNAYESNERQLTIVSDLLRVAHIDAGKVRLVRQRVDLVQLIQDVIDGLNNVFKRRYQEVNFVHPKTTVTAEIDVDRIRMVIENIVDNASKYTPEGKNLEVTLRQRPSCVEIEVKDEGVGIPRRDINKMFQKFSRLNNPLSQLVGGTGLGLYWAKRIIDLHEGEITVSSKVGKGSVFTISIPV